MKKLFYLLIISLLLISCTEQQPKTENNQNRLVILSVNDMHGHIENMPKLAYIADSLRNIYPHLIIVSAGDNRTGNAYNDKYPNHPNLPMINLMNEIGFDVTALGNHEFDDNIDGIRYVLKNANFPIICANADFSAYPDIKIPPYVTIKKKIDGKDLKIIILGVIETSNEGRPSAHVKNLKNMEFTPANDVIDDYLYLRDSCDVFILLSHCGAAEEYHFAQKYPQFDLIIGGHSHDLCNEQYSDGVLYTQAKYYLKRAIVNKFRIENGEIKNKKAYIINLEKTKKVNKNIQKEVDKYYAEPEFHKVIGHATTPFNDKNALGAFMADAQRYATKTDIAMQNPGGVRLDNLHGGDITKADIYNLDPFNNSLVICEMTGEQVEDFLGVASTKDGYLTHVSGITYTITHFFTHNNGDFYSCDEAFIDGKPIDKKKIYTVTINSYMASSWAKDYCISMRDSDISANDAEFLYLEDNKDIDYQGVKRFECEIIQE